MSDNLRNENNIGRFKKKLKEWIIGRRNERIDDSLDNDMGNDRPPDV